MVHDHPTNSRLATVAVGDLRAASACAEVLHARLALALNEHDARLADVPPGQLLALSEQIAALEATAGRVLRRIDPNAAGVLAAVGELSRDSRPQDW